MISLVIPKSRGYLGGVVEPVSADHNGKELPDVTELKDKTLDAIVMLDKP